MFLPHFATAGLYEGTAKDGCETVMMETSCAVSFVEDVNGEILARA